MIIPVFVQDATEFRRSRWTLRILSDLWRQSGHTLHLVDDPSLVRGGRFAINHYDLTRTPDDVVAAFDRFDRVLNGAVIDISKRRVSDQLLRAKDDWSGPVIIKTDNNFGGMPEVARKLELGHVSTAEVEAWGWSDRESLSVKDYPVLDGLGAVPAGVWENPQLVVEKYLPEQSDDGRLWTRCWNFLGDRGFYVRVSAPDPVLRGPQINERVVLDVAELPEEVRRKRLDMRMDYGRMDFAIVNGEAVIYDCNRTPASTRKAVRAYDAQLRALARGLADLVPGGLVM